MLQNSSNKPDKQVYRWRLAFLLPAWVLLGYVVSQMLLLGIFWVLNKVGVPFEIVSQVVFNTIAAALAYALALLLVLGVPWWVRQRRTTAQDLGVTRLPSWLDIGLAPVGFITYFMASSILVYVVTLIVPEFDIEQVQNVGFSNLTRSYELILAFATLVVLAPLAEELLFRGYLYGKLRKSVPMWAAALITSAIFGLVHGQWNVAVDVFALSVVMCGLREFTGSIWSGVILHMMKNGLAFYLLFINPTILTTIGG